MPQDNPNDTMIKIAGMSVPLSDVRGVITDKENRSVLLQNGMKLAITAEERELLRKVMNRQADLLTRKDRSRGTIC